MLGGSGGGGGGDDSEDREGAGGGGSGGAIWIVTPTLTITGTISAVGGAGGLDDFGGGSSNNDGGAGGDGRIKIEVSESVDMTGTAAIRPPALSRPALVPFSGGDLAVAAGEVVTLNTDGYSSFQYNSLVIDEGGVLTAVGSLPLVLELANDCIIGGTLDVSGGAGSPGQERLSGAGGGAGGGAVQIITPTLISVGVSGAILAEGGAGGQANLGSPGLLAGQAGLGVAGGGAGGRGSRWSVDGNNGGTVSTGVGIGAGAGSVTSDRAQPAGGGGAGHATAGADGFCETTNRLGAQPEHILPTVHSTRQIAINSAPACANRTAPVSCDPTGGIVYGDIELTELTAGSGAAVPDRENHISCDRNKVL